MIRMPMKMRRMSCLCAWTLSAALLLGGCSNPGFGAESDQSAPSEQKKTSAVNSHREGKKVNGAHVNQFYLIDPQTQMLIMKYKHPAGWMTSAGSSSPKKSAVPSASVKATPHIQH